MVGRAKKLRHAMSVFGVGTVLFVAGCDDPTGLISGGSDGLSSMTSADTGGPETTGLEVSNPDPLADVPAIPTRAPETAPVAEPAQAGKTPRHLGAFDDVTAAVVAQLGGNPEARTIEELAKLVADLRDGDGATEMEIGTAAESMPGDAADGIGAQLSIMVERTGVPDDSVLGERLIVHGRAALDHDGVELIAVERHVLCRSGATDDGRCI